MLDPEDRAAVIRVGRPRRYRRGAPIVIQGDHSDTVFVVVAGRVKVTMVTADGREILLAVDGPGELLGEFEAVDPDSGPRTAANVALEPVECREMTGQEFRDLLDTHPRIPLMLLRWTIRRLKWADRRRIDAASSDTSHRLARLGTTVPRRPCRTPLLTSKCRRVSRSRCSGAADSRQPRISAVEIP